MLGEFKQYHWNSPNGSPAGGSTSGLGFCISWQNGGLGRGPDRSEPNGAFVETIIAAAKGRLEHFQASGLSCEYNAVAIMHLERALEALDRRTKDREARDVEGTHRP